MKKSQGRYCLGLASLTWEGAGAHGECKGSAPVQLRCREHRNKARLVAQGHTQEEGIDYEEVFAPVARIEAIRLFIGYASFVGFMVYQMDVKSAFRYETTKEEVYVCQPPLFEDPDYPDKVYKVVKALYRLHQALRAWYETLVNYLLENGFQRGKIDQTLFIKKQKGDILLVQVYVDDLIFGSTNKDFKAEARWDIISQDKYVAKILRKFGLTDGKSASTPIDTKKPLLKDPDREDVDVYTYRLMIGSLMYLTSSRPDIMYFKGKIHFGLWYHKDSPFNLVAYSDSDCAGAILDRKSTTGGAMDSKSIAGLWGIIAYLDADKDVTLEEVEVEKNDDVEKNVDVQGRPEESQAKVYHIDLEHADKVLSMQDDVKEPSELQENMDGFKRDYFKGMSYDDIRPIFEKYFSSNVAFLEKSKEQLEEEESKALKRTSESLEEKTAKKQKLDEEVLVVDYEIYTKNNKPHYKIIRVDGTHELFLSFLSLLRNFDREDVEMLWQIVQDRFISSKPKNFSNDFLLTTLKAMFEKTDVEAQVWKSQRGIHDDLAGIEKISIDKVHFGSNAQ
nr:hypothetical protein [Tanacetum cinerariifolium]